MQGGGDPMWRHGPERSKSHAAGCAMRPVAPSDRALAHAVGTVSAPRHREQRFLGRIVT